MCINMVNGHNQCVIWSMDGVSMVNGHNQCVSIWLMDITSVYQYG